jgi:hypothetical protein
MNWYSPDSGRGLETLRDGVLRNDRPIAGVRPVVLALTLHGVGSEKRTRFLWRLDGVWATVLSLWDCAVSILALTGDTALERLLLRRKGVGSVCSSMMGDEGSRIYLSSPSTKPSQSRYL